MKLVELGQASDCPSSSNSSHNTETSWYLLMRVCVCLFVLLACVFGFCLYCAKPKGHLRVVPSSILRTPNFAPSGPLWSIRCFTRFLVMFIRSVPNLRHGCLTCARGAERNATRRVSNFAQGFVADNPGREAQNWSQLCVRPKHAFFGPNPAKETGPLPAVRRATRRTCRISVGLA